MQLTPEVLQGFQTELVKLGAGPIMSSLGTLATNLGVGIASKVRPVLGHLSGVKSTAMSAAKAAGQTGKQARAAGTLAMRNRARQIGYGTMGLGAAGIGTAGYMLGSSGGNKQTNIYNR